MPLSEAPTDAIAFALGYAAARPQSADTFGPFCAMVEELQARRMIRVTHDDVIRGGVHPNAYEALLHLLPPELSGAIRTLYMAQRGQRWSRTGEYRRGSGNSD